MLLTVYYMAATFFQSFKLRSFAARIAKQLNERVSVVFYNYPEPISDASATASTEVAVSSELCVNQREARIADVLWHQGSQRGCTVEPRQIISINRWITFPKTPLNIPIRMNSHREAGEHQKESIYMLLEATFHPPSAADQSPTPCGSREQFMGFSGYTNSLFVEDFGEPVAWRVDSHFSFLLRTDRDRLLQFIAASFLANNFAINNDLQLMRIESVDAEGEAQPFESIRQHTKKDVFEIEPRILDNAGLRQKYMSLLTNLCFLAHQADEFNAEKARQGGSAAAVETPKRKSPTAPRERPPSTSPPPPPQPKQPEPVIDQGARKKYLKRTKRSEGSFISAGKPPNILVYSESSAIRENTLVALKHVLKPDTYTVYPLSAASVKSRIWQDNTRLLVVCGPLSPGIGSLLLEFYLNQSGNMLCLCSDLLHELLPNYRTAEVREQELAQFSYNRWQKVPMMHHIFCYQPSPVKKHFSHDSEDNPNGPNPKLMCPKTVEVADTRGCKHPVDVEVLGVEETWRTPSILLAVHRVSHGRAIFSQVHLEADPSQFEGDEGKFEALKGSDAQRLEILRDLLTTHLNVEVKQDLITTEFKYTHGFLLADTEARKDQFLRAMDSKLDASGCLSSAKMNLQWVTTSQEIPSATERFLPINISLDPAGFNSRKYFETLATKQLGRLAIYVPIVTSSMDVLEQLNVGHGFVVIPTYQSNGSGRGQNKWLSSDGSLMFTLQLQLRLDSVIGQRLPLLQHLTAVAIVNAIIGPEEYQDLDIRIKWPNDVYANGTIKIGGLIVATTIEGADAVCNVGVGLNVDNGSPTICINDLIRDLNSSSVVEKDLPTIEPEVLCARIFNELERLLGDVERSGSLEAFQEVYYQLWLHQDQEVRVQDHTGVIKTGTVSGIDEFGYLEVVAGGQAMSVHPDGNSFDMLRGLIFPKAN